ncbi:hypothetical protein [Mycoplasma sp. OR1901]|uniref:hypothetical protein n=1 Tax=Mycoplasma sp. OR1901 TaxID=2742195 RepID=UPI00158430C8|nr:hypothetical protein [Mycoplasma sp. OR1901]QKT05341.1 hypothetical protein HTZ87_01335 [Mycoplasma sp. OR1901]
MNRECNKRACREANAHNTMETREEKVYQPVGGTRCEDNGIANEIANQLLEDKKQQVVEQTRVGYQETVVESVVEDNELSQTEQIEEKIILQDTSEQVYPVVQTEEAHIYDLLDVLTNYKDFLKEF